MTEEQWRLTAVALSPLPAGPLPMTSLTFAILFLLHVRTCVKQMGKQKQTHVGGAPAPSHTHTHTKFSFGNAAQQALLRTSRQLEPRAATQQDFQKEMLVASFP